MSAAWILVPVVVMASSLLFIDRPRGRALGFALMLMGFVGLWAVVYAVATTDAREIAECASRGGVPANGECWIDGVKR